MSAFLTFLSRVFACACGVGIGHIIAALTWQSDLDAARLGFVLLGIFAALSLLCWWIADLVERAS